MKTLNFNQALNVICDGGKVTRVEWDNKDDYGLMQDDRLRIHLKDTFHDWIISYGDLLSEDWIIL